MGGGSVPGGGGEEETAGVCFHCRREPFLCLGSYPTTQPSI